MPPFKEKVKIFSSCRPSCLQSLVQQPKAMTAQERVERVHRGTVAVRLKIRGFDLDIIKFAEYRRCRLQDKKL